MVLERNFKNKWTIKSKRNPTAEEITKEHALILFSLMKDCGTHSGDERYYMIHRASKPIKEGTSTLVKLSIRYKNSFAGD
jgi:hypothetical protein